MKFEFINNNQLIICPNSYKLAILKYLEDNNKILNIKFMNLNEYKKHLLFDYDEKTIHYLVNKNIKVENAITLINNLYYIENKDYNLIIEFLLFLNLQQMLLLFHDIGIHFYQMLQHLHPLI